MGGGQMVGSDQESCVVRDGQGPVSWVSGQGLEFRVSGFGFRVSGFGFRVSGIGFRVQGLGFRVQGFGCRVQGSGFGVYHDPHPRQHFHLNSGRGFGV